MEKDTFFDKLMGRDSKSLHKLAVKEYHYQEKEKKLYRDAKKRAKKRGRKEPNALDYDWLKFIGLKKL